MANRKPLVAVACVCERVLQEKDNVHSIIRIVDTLNLEVPATLPPNVRPPVPVTVYVSLKGGEAAGSHVIALVLRSPSGKRSHAFDWRVSFESPEQGANAMLNLTITEPQFEGLYWIDVMWKDEVLTGIPFKLRLAARQVEGSPSTGQ
jgi:hypothetical protein